MTAIAIAPDTEARAVPSPSVTAAPVASLPLLWVVAAQIPLIFAYGRYVSEKPHYQFVPLSFLAAVWIAWASLRRGPELQPGRAAMVIRFLIVALALQFAGFLVHSYLPIGISLIASLTAVTYAAGSWRGVFRCWPSFGLLGLSICPPFGLDERFVLGLRDLASNLGSRFLNLSWIHIAHLQNGNVLEVSGHHLFVSEACSGVNSLFSSLCCVLVWAGVTRLHWLETLVLLVAAVFWLTVANTLRLVLIAVATAWWDFDLTSGWKHEALGVATYAVGLFLTWSTGQGLLFFFRSRSSRLSAQRMSAKASDELPAAPALACSKLTGWTILTATALVSLAFVGFYRKDITNSTSDRNETVITNRLERLTQNDLPTSGPGWNIEQFKEEKRDLTSAFGEHSRYWRGHIGAFKANVSVDYPFLNYHDLTICYRSQGWEIGTPIDVASPTDDGATIKEVLMSRPGLQSGYLLFGLYDSRGEPLRQPDVSNYYWSPRVNSFLGLMMGQSEQIVPTAYQVQVHVIGSGEFDPASRQAARDLFTEACRTAKKRMVEGDGQ